MGKPWFPLVQMNFFIIFPAVGICMLSKYLNSNIAYSLKTLSKPIRIFSTNKQSRLLIAKKNYGMKDAKTKEVRLIHVIRDLS